MRIKFKEIDLDNKREQLQDIIDDWKADMVQKIESIHDKHSEKIDEMFDKLEQQKLTNKLFARGLRHSSAFTVVSIANCESYVVKIEEDIEQLDKLIKNINAEILTKTLRTQTQLNEVIDVDDIPIHQICLEESSRDSSHYTYYR
ncbi:unnamed protein product [Didymodactylos carnosus]|uniref:Uncharacterized protein n=1 Tax=Didymodactylos carnosus TaxID=1234261 RepID=A0A815F8S9_9BILA|nr:unnamed protein product [Didymodactylos carnosus]CAF4157892.1 unnamed protein product [Didymodactylos carnosus]